MRHTETALKWIVNILREFKIPFEIDGGLAAEAYGSNRELADIDINVAQEDFDKIVPQVKEYLKFGPDWYKDEHWRLYMMTIKYAGQNIDISALGKIHFYDKEGEQWKDFPSDMSGTRIMNWLGMDLPFVNEIKLMIYKQKLGRGVDRKDVHAMTNQLKEEWNDK